MQFNIVKCCQLTCFHEEDDGNRPYQSQVQQKVLLQLRLQTFSSLSLESTMPLYPQERQTVQTEL